MAVIISFANQKGGVGKTTSAISLGHWFALHNTRTLILDLDGQGHVASALGLAKTNGLFRLLVEEKEIRSVTTKARNGLDAILNDHTNELVKEHIKQANFREYLLNTILDEAREDYDLILIDTPPSTDVLHVLALVASDYLIIPANMDYLALDGVGYILKTLKSLRSYPGVTPPVLIGVLPTLYDQTTNETTNNVRQLQVSIGADRILPPIPRDTKVREAASSGKTIWEYAPKSTGAIGFGNGSPIRNSQQKTGGYLHLAEIVSDLISRR